MNLAARFIDLLITARVTNYRSLDYSTIKNYIFNVTKDIRRCSLKTLKFKLGEHYKYLKYKPEDAIPYFGLNNFTKKYIKNILARITSYIEEQMEVNPNYCDYMNTKTRNPFEIEHIISNNYEWFKNDYSTKE